MFQAKKKTIWGGGTLNYLCVANNSSTRAVNHNLPVQGRKKLQYHCESGSRPPAMKHEHLGTLDTNTPVPGLVWPRLKLETN